MSKDSHACMQGDTAMSWMSKKTGRPKEDGGHKRMNISVDEFTLNVLQEADNKSKLVEHSLRVLLNQPRWIRFRERDESTNNDQYVFKDAATFVWTPNNGTNNAIFSTRCHFQYRCEGKGLRFIMTINGETVMSSNGWLTSANYTSSLIYTGSNSSSDEGMKTFPNQSDYNIKFQFEPQSSEDTAYVKDINVYIEVADGMLAITP